MKIAHYSHQLLVLRSAPWELGYFFVAMIIFVTWLGLAMIGSGVVGSGIGLLVICLGILFFAMFHLCQRKEVILDRQAQTISLQRYTLLKTSHDSFDLRQLVEANVEDQSIAVRRIGSLGKMYLVFGADDPAAVTRRCIEAVSFGDDKIRAANTINTWLSMDVDSLPPQA